MCYVLDSEVVAEKVVFEVVAEKVVFVVWGANDGFGFPPLPPL